MLLEVSRQECAELKAQLVARDQAISDLQVKFANQPQFEPFSAPSHSDDLRQLNLRIEELAVQQSNILAFVLKQLASNERAAEPADQRLMKQKEVIAYFDAQAAAQQQKLEAANQKVQQFALSLQVPDEIALMDAATGLDVPGLNKYWPYFHAKRERDEIQRFAAIAKMKALSEKLDQEGDPIKPSQQ